jgi:hypothetical protein
MSRHVRLGYGRIAAAALAVIATTWGAGTAIAASGSVTTAGTLAAGTTAAGTPTLGTPPPTGTGSAPGSTSPTPCPPGPGTGGTQPPPLAGFEDGGAGGAGGWAGDPGVTVRNTDEIAADGRRSLRADGVTDTAGINLPADNSRREPTAWHRVTAKVRLAPGSQAAYVQLKPTSAYQPFSGVVRATADTWTTVTAWYWPNTLYWDNYCNGQMYGGSYQVLSSLKVLLSGDACGDARRGPVTLFVDDVLTEIVLPGSGTPLPTGGGPSGGPPQSPSTVQCGPSTSPPAPVCTARYTTVNQWNTGYLAAFHLVNASGKPLSAWTLAWTFPGKQVIGSLWGAKDYRQNGAQVTLTGPSWSVVPPGGAVDVGFVASGTPGTPQQVTLNGTSCSVTTA